MKSQLLAALLLLSGSATEAANKTGFEFPPFAHGLAASLQTDNRDGQFLIEVTAVQPGDPPPIDLSSIHAGLLDRSHKEIECHLKDQPASSKPGATTATFQTPAANAEKLGEFILTIGDETRSLPLRDDASSDKPEPQTSREIPHTSFGPYAVLLAVGESGGANVFLYRVGDTDEKDLTWTFRPSDLKIAFTDTKGKELTAHLTSSPMPLQYNPPGFDCFTQYLLEDLSLPDLDSVTVSYKGESVKAKFGPVETVPAPASPDH